MLRSLNGQDETVHFLFLDCPIALLYITNTMDTRYCTAASVLGRKRNASSEGTE